MKYSPFWKVEEPSTTGQITAYICRRCGFTELYTWDAASLPLNEIGGKLLTGDAQAPYR